MIAKVVVTVIGVALIILVNWFFLFSRKRAPAEVRMRSRLQEVKVMIKGGFTPDLIVVRRGKPVRLHFYRDETARCSDDIVIRDFQIQKPLLPYRTTSVEFTPDREGEYEFTCGEGMAKGRLIVRKNGKKGFNQSKSNQETSVREEEQ